MNENIKTNFIKILLIFICIQPLLDVLTGMILTYTDFTITIGTIIRTLFLGISFIYLIFFNSSKFKRYTTYYLISLFIYCILYVFNIYFIKGVTPLFYEINNLIKVIYFPIILVLIFNLYRDNIIKIKQLSILFIIYTTLVLIPNIFNIGFSSYDITKAGTTGWFYTANEIGAIISLLMPIYIYYISEKKNKIYLIISLIVITYLLTSIGTKGPLICFGLIILISLIKIITGLIRKKEYKKITALTLLILLTISISVYLIPKTTFYKNIKTHLDFLEVTNITEILTSYEIFDHFIFSQRLTFLEETHINYQNSSISEKILGIGYIENYNEINQNEKFIEIDYFDIFYRHGILGFIIILLPYFYLIFNILKLIKLKYLKNNKLLFLSTSLLISILLAFFTGHTLTAPGVSIFVAIVIILLYNEIRRLNN